MDDQAIYGQRRGYFVMRTLKLRGLPGLSCTAMV